MNYYTFDSITKDDDNQYWGHLGDQSTEIYPTDSDPEAELIEKGFAKCDAPGTETFLVEETAWAAIYAAVAPEAPGTCPICGLSFGACEHFTSLDQD